jgi:hypothetical protein
MKGTQQVAIIRMIPGDEAKDEAASCVAFTGRQADRRQFGLSKYGTSSRRFVPGLSEIGRKWVFQVSKSGTFCHHRATYN